MVWSSSGALDRGDADEVACCRVDTVVTQDVLDGERHGADGSPSPSTARVTSLCITAPVTAPAATVVVTAATARRARIDVDWLTFVKADKLIHPDG